MALHSQAGGVRINNGITTTASYVVPIDDPLAGAEIAGANSINNIQ